MTDRAVIILKNNLFAEALASCLEDPGRLECRTVSLARLLSPRKFDETDYTRAIILLELNGNGRENSRVFHRVRNQWPESRSILFSETADAEEIADLFSRGAWGIFSPSDGIDILKKAIRTVSGGEIWACRQNSSHIIRHLRKTDRRAHRKDGSVLSGRECQVLSLVAGGLKNKQIADKLCISEQTVKVHLNNIFKKIGVKDRLQAALFAMDKGLTPGNVRLEH
jgi:DNA-binding NarL/FixJ family response regulator